MASRLKRTVLRPIPYLFSDRTGHFMIKLLTKTLREELYGKVTDKFLELLLQGMDLAFCLSKDYRKNIKNFKARYVFRTSKNTVSASATFRDGEMEVHKEVIEDWESRVTFKDSSALMTFIFSRDQDILDYILNNDVEVDGNLNFIYKFGFMARDLTQRLGVA